MLVPCLASALTMRRYVAALRSVNFCQTTRRYVTKELVLTKCFTAKKLCLRQRSIRRVRYILRHKYEYIYI
jgi:hypothetical protein